MMPIDSLRTEFDLKRRRRVSIWSGCLKISWTGRPHEKSFNCRFGFPSFDL
jgi:hypothetical protein